jgi:FlaA1/EpsC-like NDP-sugar epimerase
MPTDYLPYNEKYVARNTTRLIFLVFELALALFSWLWAAYLLHGLNDDATRNFLVALPTLVLMALRLSAFLFFKTANLIIRYIGEKDYKTVFVAISSSSLAFALIYGIFFLNTQSSRGMAVILVDYFFMLTFSVGFRIGLRLLYDWLKRPKDGAVHVAIFGAGEMGNILERVLHKSTTHNYKVVTFFDDNPKVHKKSLNGIPVFNPDQTFEQVVRKFGIKAVIIGIRYLPDERRASFINDCLKSNLQVLKLPPAEYWIHGQVNASQILNVNLDDLLGRSPIVLDEGLVRDSIKGRVVLVSGCAGSIGSEILRQLLRQAPACVVGVDQAESPLADLSLEFEKEITSGRLIPFLGDVRDHERMQRIFEVYRPAYVFHAAAYKHVPIMELFPEEAVKSNVLGTKVIADLASRYRCEKFVMISTDKAVNPGNVMGASKRIAEIYVQALNFAGLNYTRFITTRFGNVLGSNGSVIPIFKEQIQRGGPVTVTHPEIKRFFMTIPEACSLVLEAGAFGKGGEIFIFDMGEPIRILDLAHRMIQLAGLTPEKDIIIQFTGLRPGEKLFEELLDKKETVVETHHPKIFRAKVRPGIFEEISPKIDHLITSAHDGYSANKLVSAMKRLVPEFISQNSIYSELDHEV